MIDALPPSLVQYWPTIATIIASGTGLYLLWVLYERIMAGDGASLRMTSKSGAGATSVTLSGTHVTATLVAIIAVVTWPAAVEAPALGGLLMLAVVGHYILEKSEADGS